MPSACTLCGKPPEDVLVLREQDVVMCWTCVAALGRFLVSCDDAFLAGLWGQEPPPIPSKPCDVEAFRSLGGGGASYGTEAARLDLGQAFAHAGLASDAIRLLAGALEQTAAVQIAQSAFTSIFATPFLGWARPDTLARAIRAFRDVH